MLDLGTLQINIKADGDKAIAELKVLQSKVEETEKQTEKSTSSMSKSWESFGASAKAAIALSIGAATATIGELISIANETQEDMGKLAVAFDQAGFSAETAQGTFEDMVGLLGETDTAVEASNHLAKLAKSEEDLAKWSDIAAGVFATWTDSINLESLTEAANETAKTGTLVSALSDALVWAGVSEDEFNQKLAACNDEQERAQLITQTLSDLYSDAGQQYKENNEALIEYRKAQAEFNNTLGELGMEIMPIVSDAMGMFSDLADSTLSPMIDVIADIVGWFSDLDEGTQQLVGSLGLMLAGAKPLVSIMGTFRGITVDAVGGIKDFSKSLKDSDSSVKNFTKSASAAHGAIDLLAGIILTVAIGALIDYATKAEDSKNATENLVKATENIPGEIGKLETSIDSASKVMDGYARSADEATQAQAELSKEIQESWQNLSQDSSLVEYYVGVIEDLSGKTNLTAEEQFKLETAVKGVNEVCGTNIEVIDKVNGQLSMSVDEIKKSTQAWLDNAKAQAAQEQMVQLQKEEIQTTIDLAEAQKKYESAQSLANEAVKNGQPGWESAVSQANAYKDEVDQLTRNLEANKTAQQNLMDAMGMASEELLNSLNANEAFKTAMDNLGISIDSAANAIAAFGISAQEANEMSTEQLTWLAQNAGASAETIAAKFSELNWKVPESMRQMLTDAGYAIDENGYVVVDAASNTADEAVAGMDKTAEAQNVGSQTADSYASGVSSGSGTANSSGSQVAGSAATGMRSQNGNASSWGYDLAANFANGLTSAWNVVSSAANTVAGWVQSILGHSVPEEGILRNNGKGEVPWGEHLVENIAKGMLNAKPAIVNAANEIAAEIASPLSNIEAPINLSGANNPYSQYLKYKTTPQTAKNGSVYNFNVNGINVASSNDKNEIAEIITSQLLDLQRLARI